MLHGGCHSKTPQRRPSGWQRGTSVLSDLGAGLPLVREGRQPLLEKLKITNRLLTAWYLFIIEDYPFICNFLPKTGNFMMNPPENPQYWKFFRGKTPKTGFFLVDGNCIKPSQSTYLSLKVEICCFGKVFVFEPKVRGYFVPFADNQHTSQ
jgi:hypothetical protein